MTKPHLLLVDGDAGELRLMEASLLKAGFAVTAAFGGGDALARCRVVRPDLILSETEMPGVDGFELCRTLKADERLRDVPFVFLTARHRSVDDKLRGLELGDDYLVKPIAVREVVARVRIHLERKEKERLQRSRAAHPNLSGTLADMSVVELAQALEIGRKTGAVHLDDAHGRTGTISVRNGRIVDCVAGHLSAERAFHRLVRWREGRFAIELGPVNGVDRIGLPTELLLIDAARRLDEWRRAVEQLPPLDSVVQLDHLLLSERLAEIPDDVNAILKLIDGRRTLAAIVEESECDELAAASALLGLFRDGIVAAHAMPPSGAAPTSTPNADAPAAPPPLRAADPGARVDWSAGPATGELPPGSAAPGRSAPPRHAPVAPPRIVRFTGHPASNPIGRAAQPGPSADHAAKRNRRRLTVVVAVVAAGLLVFAAWVAFARSSRNAARPAVHLGDAGDAGTAQFG